jgi:uncharacterized membrane protein (Fun14 family)
MLLLADWQLILDSLQVLFLREPSFLAVNKEQVRLLFSTLLNLEKWLADVNFRQINFQTEYVISLSLGFTVIKSESVCFRNP